jgi:outer membrane receptor for ferric coprogen and ferric-rhodotorulic acid
VEIQITAQPLSQALVVLARQAHLELMVQPALVEGRTPAVQGRFTVREALNRLLAGSGLYAEVEGRSVVVRRLSQSSDAATLPTVTVSALEERGATTEGSDSFAARAVSINKGDQALKDIPQSISVITRKQLDEQGITDLKQAANIATGTVGVTGVGQGMVLAARGFQIDNWQYDGVAIPRNMYSLGNWAAEGMVFYDRLEVLRGASGLLQGTGSPGGAVNLAQARPEREDRDADHAYRLMGPLRRCSWTRRPPQCRRHAARPCSGGRSPQPLFVDYVNERSRSLYAALDYDISPDTTVGLA